MNLSEKKKQLETSGVSQEKITQLCESVEDEFRQALEDRGVEIQDTAVVPMIQGVFLDSIYKIGMRDNSTVREEVENAIESLQEGRGRTDIVWTISTAQHKYNADFDELQQFNEQVVADNYSER